MAVIHQHSLQGIYNVYGKVIQQLYYIACTLCLNPSVMHNAHWLLSKFCKHHNISHPRKQVPQQPWMQHQQPPTYYQLLPLLTYPHPPQQPTYPQPLMSLYPSQQPSCQLLQGPSISILYYGVTGWFASSMHCSTGLWRVCINQWVMTLAPYLQ